MPRTNKSAHVVLHITPDELRRIDEFREACGAKNRSAMLRSIILAVIEDDAKAHQPIDVDGTVARILVLWGSGELSSADIAKAIGMSEAFVTRVLTAWREERRVA